MEVPFYRKYSLEPEQQKILKTAVLASIEHMKTLGGFYWYDDKGPRNPDSIDTAIDQSGFRKFNEMKLTYNNMTYSDYHNNGKEGMISTNAKANRYRDYYYGRYSNKNYDALAAEYVNQREEKIAKE